MKAKVESWHRFWSLSAHSRSLVVEAAVALTATWIGLRVAGYRRWRRILDKLAPETIERTCAGDPVALGSAQAIARFEQSAARHLFLRTNCLEQALVLCWLLRRRGIEAEMRMGARKDDGRFEAHAWVEFGGTVLNDALGQHRHFTRFEGTVIYLEIQTP